MMYAISNFIDFREVGEREAAALLACDVSGVQSPSARFTAVAETEDDA